MIEQDCEAKKTLNFFRRNNLAFSLSCIRYGEIGLMLPFVYNDYFNMTMDIFIVELRRFENSTECPTAYNAMLLSIFTDVFCLIEQFISSVYILIYFYCISKEIPDKKTSSKMFKQDYLKTLNSIFQLGEIDSTSFKEAKMFNYLKELEDARNYILHGNVGTIKITKTNLPELPLTINIEDIMEEINIMINLINHFRYIFPGLDLMPNIRLNFQKTFIFKKIDDYFYKVLVPYFHMILQKHALYPSRSYELTLKPLKSIQKTIAKEIGVIIKAIPEDEFDYDMNQERTDYLSSLIFNIVDIKEVQRLEDEGLFQIPEFMIKK